MAAKSSRRNKVSSKKQHPGLPGPKTLDLVDLFLFLLDSRIPQTSLRISEPYLLKKRRVYVMTKPDLADPSTTQEWVDWFKAGGVPCFAVESNTGRGMSDLVNFLDGKQADVARKAHSMILIRPLRIMLFGLPNVGKSSLANRLLGTSKAPFGAKPGLTRGSHWLRGRGPLEILDTPGVIDTSKVKGEVLHKLAATWAVRENQYDEGEVAIWLAREVFDKQDPLSHITEFGRSKGLIGPGGNVDFSRACKSFIQAFRYGNLGRVSIETPG
jgi:ribosome biogenesis GTPase A